jgi:hypothetical protein
MNLSALKKPSAWIPIVMSLAALGLVLAHYAVYGITRDPDEGAAAHTFQLLMAGQLPVIVYFALRWLPRIPGQALLVLALQGAAGLAAFASVYFLT